jgi:hypothetical protein
VEIPNIIRSIGSVESVASVTIGGYVVERPHKAAELDMRFMLLANLSCSSLG